MKLIFLAAVSENSVIGKNGAMPWKIPSEMKFFKKTTTGYPVIMGRKTFQSLGGALRDRINIVLTRSGSMVDGTSENLKFFDSIDHAMDFVKGLKTEKAFVIGGGQIFNQMIDFADELIISKIKGEFEGDVLFPQVNWNNWKLVNENVFDEFKVEHFCRKELDGRN